MKKDSEKDSEKAIERRLVEGVKKAEGLCIKILCNHMIGMPDRMCLLPGGKIIFVELKSENEKPTKIQTFRHKNLVRLGFKVYVIDCHLDLDFLLFDIE